MLIRLGVEVAGRVAAPVDITAGRRKRVPDIDDVLLGIGAGQQPRRTVLEQQDDGPGLLKAEQVAPADAHPPRPHAGILRPLRQRRRRGRGLAGRPAELVRVELDPVIPPGLDRRLQSRIDRQAPDGTDGGRAERARRAGLYRTPILR